MNRKGGAGEVLEEVRYKKSSVTMEGKCAREMYDCQKYKVHLRLNLKWNQFARFGQSFFSLSNVDSFLLASAPFYLMLYRLFAFVLSGMVTPFVYFV